MLYNLDWIAPGKMFPPQSQQKRLKKYQDNKRLFESEHSEVYRDQMQRIIRYIDRVGYASYPVILNYNKLISLKTADLVAGEPPVITTKNETTNDLEEITRSTKINQSLYESVIDISRYGSSVWRVYKNDQGKGMITVWSPSEWFPVVSAEDKKTVIYHVIAWISETKESAEEEKQYELHVQIHERGKYSFRRYAYSGRTIGKLIEEAQDIPTGLSDFAILHLSNVVTSDSIYGHDDYTTIDSIISELCVRIAQVSRVLDKHAQPSMYGDQAVLEQDPQTGEYTLPTGNYFTVPSGGIVPGYLTWDGNLSASFQQIETLLNQLYIISEMGAALLGTQDQGGQATSGTALRLKMTNPLIKSRRIATLIEEPVKKAISLVSEIGYIRLDPNEIDIKWQDGLPNDESLETKIVTERIANGTMSEEDAIVRLDRVSAEDAEIRAEIIRENKTANDFTSMFTQPEKEPPDTVVKNE